MIRFLIRLAIFLASSALGLLIATLIVPGFSITVRGFVIVVVVFALLQSLLAPAFSQAANRKAPALLGGVGLASTFVALFICNLATGAITLDGITAWILATLAIWIVTMLATLFLPMIFLKNRIEERRDAA